MSKTLTVRLFELRSQAAYIPATLRLIWKAARRYTLAWLLLLVVQGLLPAAQLFLIRPLVDSLVAALGTGLSWEYVGPVLLFASLMAATILLTLAIGSALGWIRATQAELTRDNLAGIVHAKATELDLAFYEIPDYHDLLDRARSDLRERPLDLLESIGDLAKSGITLVAMGAILLKYGVWMPLALLVSTFPILYVVVIHNRRYHDWWKQTTPERRWSQYYDNLLTLDAAAAEVRLFDLGPHFQTKYQTLRRRLRGERLSLLGRQNAAQFGAGLASLLVTGSAMAWMVWQGLRGLVTLGDIALLYQALNKGQGLMSSLLSNLGRLYSSTLFLSNLFDFLALEPRIVQPPKPLPVPDRLRGGIEFRDVSFRYPGSDRLVFDQFNFHIPAGKIVAIVGSNGAGKTTLMKLLCRFYDPEGGTIELDGTDLRELSLPELRRTITGLFQFPVPYLATVQENITLGDPVGPHSRDDVEAAARRAGAHDFIMQLPNDYATLLGKWFPEGVQLSGGEWQRLALARSFLREAPIMILDEPTSYLDSWAELDWYDRFRQLANGRTAILITHRFITARRADVIHVMDQGRIVESGTHLELVDQGGVYADSWIRQTKEESRSTL